MVKVKENKPMHDFFAGGGAAIAAITIVHPIDVVKTRLQMQGELAAPGEAVYGGITKSLTRIYKHEGFKGCYRGLQFAYGLQFSVTATRFGVYGLAKNLRNRTTNQDNNNIGSTTFQNFLLAAVSGMFGSVAGNAFYALKTRSQAYSPSSELKVGAKSTQDLTGNIVSEYLDIGTKEGIMGYFRGLQAFMPRVVAYGAVQLSTYDTAKELFLKHSSLKEGLPVHISSSIVASIFAVTAIQPFDFIAARLMNQPVDPATMKGEIYSGPIDCTVKSIRSEGVSCLFKGFTANLARMCPYTIFVLVFFEQFKKLY